MKPGLKIGDTYQYDITVDETMQAQFGAVPVHPLYSTASMISHMEWASRQHILPFLEEGEEGVGYHADVKHLAPTPVGAVVRIESTVTGFDEKLVHTKTQAWHGNRKVGEGVITQALLQLSDLHARVAQSGGGSKPSDEYRPAVLWSEDCQSSFSLVIKGFEHNFPCTRYDEWLICTGELTDRTMNFKHEGPLLLKYETEELIEALRRIQKGEQKDFKSDFMQQILSIGVEPQRDSEKQNRYRLDIAFRQPDEAKHKSEFETLTASMLCTGESLQAFCKTLDEQLERFDSSL